MKIEELDEMLRKDLSINPSKLIEASLETPTLHAKWMKFLTEETYRLHILNQRMDKLWKGKWNFYSGRGTATQNMAWEQKNKKSISSLKLAKGEIEYYVKADDDIQILSRDIKQKELLVDRLGEAVKSIQYRHLNIKNAIEIRKLESGIV